MRLVPPILALLLCLTMTACRADPVPVYGYEPIADYPHDPNAFTQGLLWADGVLYESTGLRGRSTLRRVDLETGRVQQATKLPDRFFGEGIALVDDRLYMLTWQAGLGFVLDRDSLELIKTFRYDTEGWGLTYDGDRLIMSDGSSTLYFLDPDTLSVTGQVRVTAAGMPVARLNELEFIRGEVWANVWQSRRIARIDPDSGRVTGWVDLSGLYQPRHNDDVLNGIAYDADNDRLFVTGKLWPKLFEIRLVEPP